LTLIHHHPVALELSPLQADGTDQTSVPVLPPSNVSLAYLWSGRRLRIALIQHGPEHWTLLPLNPPEGESPDVPWIDFNDALRLRTDAYRTFLAGRPSPEQIETALAQARAAQQERYPALARVVARPDLADLKLLREAWTNQPLRTPVLKVTPGGWTHLMKGSAPAEHAGSSVFVVQNRHLTNRWHLPAGQPGGEVNTEHLGEARPAEAPVHGETRMVLHHSFQPAYPTQLLAITIDEAAYDLTSPGTAAKQLPGRATP